MHGTGQGHMAGNKEAWMWVRTCVGGGTALLWAGKRGRRSGRVGGGRDAWEEARTCGRNAWWDHGTRDEWVRPGTCGSGEGRHEWGQNSDEGRKMGDEGGKMGDEGGRGRATRVAGVVSQWAGEV